MIRLRAIKGHMGNTEYFLTTATFGEVARIVNYKENKPKDWPVELQKQRPLNMSRVRNHMVPYLLEHEDRFYNALVVEHSRPTGADQKVKFVPDAGEGQVGWVELEGGEILEALDGQHRLKSIEIAVAQNPDLASETIGLVIVPHQSVKISQQRFSDLNRNAKPSPKSLNIMFEHRDESAFLAKELANRSTYLKARVNLTGSSLSDRSPYVTTISTLFEAVKITKEVLQGSDKEERLAHLVELWDTALGALPQMKEVVSGACTPGQLRKQYVYPTGIGFEALAQTIVSAVKHFPDKWADILSEGLPRIKWELKDPQWEGVALFAGRIAIARAARRRTATLVKYLLGLPNGEADVQELKVVYAKLQGHSEVEAGSEELEAVYAKLKRKLPSPLLVPAAV